MAAGEPARQHEDRSEPAPSRGDEHSLTPARGDEQPLGAVTTNSGRISAARRILPEKPTLPFTRSQLTALDEALTLAGRTTGLHFSVYLGDLGEDTRAHAEALHAAIGSRAPEAVLVAVSPGQRVVEIVTGDGSGRRIADHACKLAVMSMVAAFKEGDLIGGLTSGLRMLADHAGPRSMR